MSIARDFSEWQINPEGWAFADKYLMVAILLPGTYAIAMTFSEKEILAALDFDCGPTQAPEQGSYYLESLQSEKDAYVDAMNAHLVTLLDLKFSTDPDAITDELRILLAKDRSLPDLRVGSTLQGSGQGTISLPESADVLYFSDGERVQGEYETFIVHEYFDAKSPEQFDEVADLRPFGVYLVLRNAVLISPTGERSPFGAQIALLPLNPDKLLLHRVMTS